LLLALAAAQRLPELLTNHLRLPGTDSQRTETILETQFNQRTVGSFVLVARTPQDANELLPDVEQAAQRAAAQLPSGEVASTMVVDRHVVVARIVSMLKSAEAREHTSAMRAAIGPLPGATTWLTGFPAAEHDMAPILRDDFTRGELCIALPVAVLMLAWTFGTGACLLPLVFASFTIPVTLGLVFIAAHAMELTTYVTNLVGLVGLGIAIDYSLLVVHRFREESAPGLPTDLAIVRTMVSAGRTVVFSGTAVAIGLALLILLPLPFLRGFGVGGLLIPVVSIVAALTLLPVLLSLVAGPLDHVRLIPRLWLQRREAGGRDAWARTSRWIMRRPIPIALGATAALLLLGLPLCQIELGPGTNDGLPRTLESLQGVDVLTAAVGAGATTPLSVVIDTGRAGGLDDPPNVLALGRLREQLSRDPEVAAVYFSPPLPLFVDLANRHAHMLVIGKSDFGAPASLAFVDRLRGPLIDAADFPAPATVLVGGTPAAGHDFLGIVRTWLPGLMIAILAATWVLLTRAFRSLVLPLKAIALNLLSIVAAYGATVAAFSWGWGSPFGLIGHAQVDAWIPIMVFALLFGLSMDYEVFLVSRMRESWDGGANNEDAVVEGLATTGRLVTSAGLIMAAAFAGFVVGTIVELQQLGFALTTAVLIDVTIVRALLLPATMKLFGAWNWYLPDAVARLLRVPRSPLRKAIPSTGSSGR
jgi:RND superfamily putative drug exporter